MFFFDLSLMTTCIIFLFSAVLVTGFSAENIYVTPFYQCLSDLVFPPFLLLLQN